MAPVERYVSPVAVLVLHSLLLGDIVSHSTRMREGHPEPIVAMEWTVAVMAVLTYLRTVISDPGFLQPKPSKPSRLWMGLAALGWLVVSGLGFAGLWRKGSDPGPGIGGGFGGGDHGHSNTGGTGKSRDPRDAHEARELQPIGRSALEVVGSSEVGSDPGEETINAVDLEAAAVTAVQTGGSSPSKEGSSLGAIPGSPRPGANRNRAKRFGAGRWVDATDPGEAKGRGGVTQSGHRLRFCRICSMHQPLRTKHCRDCGRCVRTHDHHCPWVGTCVGEGNRLFFFWFLVFQWLELTMFSWEGIHSLIEEEGVSLVNWLNELPGLMVGLGFMALLLFMVSCLLTFHCYLAVSNMTTWENLSWHNISYLRALAPEDGSPFSASIKTNLLIYCCFPWCPAQACAGQDPIKRTEDGWAIWELGDSHNPMHLKCELCGMSGGCILCHCFSAGLTAP